MRRGAEFMGERAADLKKLADAAQPLYEKLDDAQKRRFAMLLRSGTRPGMQNRFARWRDRAEMRGEDHRDGWRHHRGPAWARAQAGARMTARAAPAWNAGLASATTTARAMAGVIATSG